MNCPSRVTLATFVLFTSCLSLACGVAAVDSSPQYSPQYTTSGELILPTDYEKWIFVGANVGLAYRGETTGMTPDEAERNASTGAALASDGQDFHNIYLDPASYEHYVTKKTFPDLTVLVMDRYEAQAKEPQDLVTRGLFEGASEGIEVAVKNLNRPDGSDTDWAYYIFDRGDDGEMPASAPAKPDSSCYDCHLAHTDFDNVWVQFYPVIRGVNPPRAK